MPSPKTILVRAPLFILRRAADLGLDRATMLRAAELDERALVDPDGRIPIRRHLDLWRFLVDQLDDRDFGLRIGRSLELADVGLVGYLMLNSETVGEALDRLSRFGSIIDETDQLLVRRAGRHYAIGWEPIPEQLGDLRPMADLDVAALHTVLEELSGRTVVPLEVRLPYAERPQDDRPWRALFRCDITFGAPRTELVVERRVLAYDVATGDRALGDYLEQYAEQVLAELGQGDSISERVRRRLWAGMKGGIVDIETVSSALAMSPRTLQRRLRAERSSFTEIRDDLRHELATRLLPDRRLAIYEVAHLLGYSEPSTFHRAFRRWEGVAPREYRSQVA